MATLTVEASWRMARAEINTPSDENIIDTVLGYGEMLLQDVDGKYAGAIPGASIRRNVNDVREDTVTTASGAEIKFGDVMESMRLFFEKWRIEDAGHTPLTMPEAAKLTPVPSIPKPVPEYENLPPPLEMPTP